MAYLKIKIEVENPDEVITFQKGQLLGIASKLLSKNKKKELVEQKIYEQMRESMLATLPVRLKEEGVEALFDVTIEKE